MKKFSLTVACIGIISSATFAHGFNIPQDGNLKKTDKVKAAPIQQKQKAEPAQSSPVQKAGEVQKVESLPQREETKQNVQPGQPMQAKPNSGTATHKPLKKVVMANQVLKATPISVDQQKK